MQEFQLFAAFSEQKADGCKVSLAVLGRVGSELGLNVGPQRGLGVLSPIMDDIDRDSSKAVYSWSLFEFFEE